MELRFLGVGSAFNPAMGNTGAFFARGEDLYLIDSGEQAFARLLRADIFARCPGQVTILLTHMHADHAGSLGTLCLYVDRVLGRPLTIVHPNEAVTTLLTLMGMETGRYRLLPSLKADGLTATPMPANHVPDIPAFSYLITDESGTVYYSGDNGELPPDILGRLRAGDIARLYVDTNLYDQPPAHPAHLPFRLLCDLVEPPLRGRVTLMHFNSDFRRQAEAEGFACAYMDPMFD